MRTFQHPGRSPVFAENGMCATSHPLAAKVAVTMLEQGGNAVDAAMAGAFMLGLCEPAMTGLGGDLFALIKPAGDPRITGLNGSGRAPAGLDPRALRAAGHKRMPGTDAAAVTARFIEKRGATPATPTGKQSPASSPRPTPISSATSRCP